MVIQDFFSAGFCLQHPFRQHAHDLNCCRPPVEEACCGFGTPERITWPSQKTIKTQAPCVVFYIWARSVRKHVIFWTVVNQMKFSINNNKLKKKLKSLHLGHCSRSDGWKLRYEISKRYLCKPRCRSKNRSQAQHQIILRYSVWVSWRLQTRKQCGQFLKISMHNEIHFNLIGLSYTPNCASAFFQLVPQAALEHMTIN